MAGDLEGHASIKRKITNCEAHVNQRSHNPGGGGGQDETYENTLGGRQVRERKRSQGDWSMIADVHVLSYPEPILSLDMTEYDQGGATTSVET